MTQPSIGQRYLQGRCRKPVPHEFVLDALAPVSPTVRSMFGCMALYVDDKIVLILRDRQPASDNGVWLATSREHHESLRQEFPMMRSIRVLGAAVTNWQVIPADSPEFEEAALRACHLVIRGDPRIGRHPKPRVKGKLPVRPRKTGAAARRR